MEQSKEIQTFILKNITKHHDDIVSFTAKKLQIARTTVLRHLKHLIKDNKKLNFC